MSPALTEILLPCTVTAEKKVTQSGKQLYSKYILVTGSNQNPGVTVPGMLTKSTSPENKVLLVLPRVKRPPDVVVAV